MLCETSRRLAGAALEQKLGISHGLPCRSVVAERIACQEARVDRSDVCESSLWSMVRPFFSPLLPRAHVGVYGIVLPQNPRVNSQGPCRTRSHGAVRPWAYHRHSYARRRPERE